MVYKTEISIITMKLRKLLLFGMVMLVSMFSMAQDDDEDEDDGSEGGTPCENVWGTDSAETAKAVSMFNQYWQEKDYVRSFEYWYYLYNNAPCYNKRITFNGPYIIKKAIQDSQYMDRFDGLVDTLFLVHQKRIELWGNEGYVKAKWANDWARLRPSERSEALKLFDEAISLTGNNTDYKVPKDYMYAAVKEYKKKNLEMDTLLDLLDRLSAIVDYNLANNAAKHDKWLSTQEAITKMMLPYLDCDKIIALKQPQFEANKDNLNYLKSTLKLLNVGKCQKTDFYFQVSEQLYTIEPNATAALALAKAAESKGANSKAIKYYTEAAPSLKGDSLIDVYMDLARLKIKAGSLAEGRSYARKALEINPNYGEAYILIGDAYASSVTTCSGLKLKGREVYWVAVDKYAKAKAVDPSVADRATEKINKYSAYFPDQQTAFFEGITDGSSYTVGCWIGEATVVRTIKE